MFVAAVTTTLLVGEHADGIVADVDVVAEEQRFGLRRAAFVDRADLDVGAREQQRPFDGLRGARTARRRAFPSPCCPSTGAPASPRGRPCGRRAGASGRPCSRAETRDPTRRARASCRSRNRRGRARRPRPRRSPSRCDRPPRRARRAFRAARAACRAEAGAGSPAGVARATAPRSRAQRARRRLAARCGASAAFDRADSCSSLRLDRRRVATLACRGGQSQPAARAPSFVWAQFVLGGPPYAPAAEHP